MNTFVTISRHLKSLKLLTKHNNFYFVINKITLFKKIHITCYGVSKTSLNI